MPPPDKALFSMRTGVLLSGSDALFLANRIELARQNVAHTMVFYWHADDGWSGQMLATTLHSIQALAGPPKRALALGEDGQLVDLTREPQVTASFREPGDRRRPVSRLVVHEDRFYAVGGGGLVYREDAPGRWRRLDHGIPASVLFEAAAVGPGGVLYAVGWGGEVWRTKDAGWERIDSPVNSILTGVCVEADGGVLACGQRGTVLRGAQKLWRPVVQDVTNETFWSIVRFGGRTLLSTTRFLYALSDDDVLTRHSFGEHAPSTVGILSVLEDRLLCVGEADVMLWRDGAWTRIW